MLAMDRLVGTIGSKYGKTKRVWLDLAENIL